MSLEQKKALRMEFDAIVKKVSEEYEVDASVSGDTYLRVLAYNNRKKNEGVVIVNVCWDEDDSAERPKEVTVYRLPRISELKGNKDFRRIFIDTWKGNGCTKEDLDEVRRWLDNNYDKPTDEESEFPYLDPTDVIDMWDELQKVGIGTMEELGLDFLEKEYMVPGYCISNSVGCAICRSDYENMPCPMCTTGWTPRRMQALADEIGRQLKLYNFDEQSPHVEDDRDVAFWKEMEECAVRMGMQYYEDMDDVESDEEEEEENKVGMKIFVVSYLCDHCYDMSSAGTVGVFTTLEQAQKCMKDLYEDVLVSVLDQHNVETAEELKEDDGVKLCTMEKEHSIYNNGNMDEWKITEWEV